MVGALLVVPAERLDWVAGWLYLAIMTLNVAVDVACQSALNILHPLPMTMEFARRRCAKAFA